MAVGDRRCDMWSGGSSPSTASATRPGVFKVQVPEVRYYRVEQASAIGSMLSVCFSDRACRCVMIIPKNEDEWFIPRAKVAMYMRRPKRSRAPAIGLGSGQGQATPEQAAQAH